MNTKQELTKMCERILWLEKEMKDSYANYENLLTDQGLLKILKEIEADEVRHINMAQRVLSILGTC
tara:strand:- start:144 stop:341 length:198 start_codon:yes stop_codon:yes gene_type:complete